MEDTASTSKTKHEEVEEKEELAENDETLDSKETSSEVEEGEIDPQEQLQKELEEYKSKYFYLAAEMDNLQKRFQREREGLIKFGNERILTDLLEVIDNFERSMAAVGENKDQDVKNIVSGIEMIQKQLLEILKSYGLFPIKSLGKVFDPNYHEAVSQKTVEGKKDHEIIEEYQKGYTLNGRLLRAAKVVVSVIEDEKDNNNDKDKDH